MDPVTASTEQEAQPEHASRDMPPSTMAAPCPDQGPTPTPTLTPKKRKRAKKKQQQADASAPEPHDLPIPGPNPTSTIEYYSRLPVQRLLDWQLDKSNSPVVREITNNLSRLAAFVQTRGTEASEPCSFCREKQGVWQSCIIGSDTTADMKIHGSCANCRFSRRYTCAHRIHREGSADIGSPSAARGETQPPSQPTDEDAFHIARPVSDEEAEQFLILLQPKSAQGQSSPSTQKSGNVQGSEQGQSVTQGKVPQPQKTMAFASVTSDSVAARVKCRHDGKAIPFPLRPEAFHDVSLLRQSLHDMTQHYNVIRQRIEQIEGTEPHRTMVNPWDLIKE
ncbi:hypothetical protein BDV26DRAFT_294644 [Aspergillus bertholletiae]|uniref:Uncharacterized protein n=1 Tax=Aspergillus bertholletiae TaxID=1226010 RepID=A0A5N7B3S4_9EURO|nr:hypothetical protein BDV26DRAFT_294644 [Aspergillus bertholletiae]